MEMKLVLAVLFFLNLFIIPGRSTPSIVSPAGTGATPGLSAGEKGPASGGAGGSFNVMDHGAKGDGKTDDSKVKHQIYQHTKKKDFIFDVLLSLVSFFHICDFAGI